jgi:hypothetical protein
MHDTIMIRTRSFYLIFLLVSSVIFSRDDRSWAYIPRWLEDKRDKRSDRNTSKTSKVRPRR